VAEEDESATRQEGFIVFVPAPLRDKKRERWSWQKDKAAGVVG
jgi:hypothetical protein